MGGAGISHHVSAVSTEDVLDRVEELTVEVVLLRGEEIEVVNDFVDSLEDKGKGLDILTRPEAGGSCDWKVTGSERVRE